MATDAQKTANTKQMRYEVAGLAAQEIVSRDYAEDARAKALTLPKFTGASRAEWKSAADWYDKARSFADRITAWYNTSQTSPDYYPMVLPWDPNGALMGEPSWLRAARWADNQAFAAEQGKPVVLKFPLPPSGGGGGGGGGLGLSPGGPGPAVVLPKPVLQPVGGGGGAGGPYVTPPGQGGGGNGGNVPGPGGAPPGGGGLGTAPPDTPVLPPGPDPQGGGSPALWLVPVGLVGAILWHLLSGRGGRS
jgi:hypothetical protein